MTPRNSPSDDWEDVADDNFSVISLPSSEEGESITLPDATAPDLTRLRSDSPTTSSIPATRCLSDATTLPDKAHIVPSFRSKDKGKGRAETTPCEPDGTRVHPRQGLNKLLEDPFREPSASECLRFDPDESFQENPDTQFIHLDPTFLLEAAESVRKVLCDAIECIYGLPSLYRDFCTRGLQICGGLVAETAELTALVSGFAKVLSRTSPVIPLDPGFHLWLTAVRVKALDLQDGLQAGLQVGLQDEAKAAKLSLQAAGSRGCPKNHGKSFHAMPPHYMEEALDKLAELSGQMTEFLPIMQPDSNESEAKHMTTPPTSTGSQPTRSTPIDIPQPAMHNVAGGHSVCPGNDIWSFGHELYDLKDEIMRAIDNLSEHSRHLTPSLEMWAVHVLHQYCQVADSIARVLSITPWGWKQGPSRGMTYVEYVQLDTGRVRQYSERLHQVLDSLEAAYLASRERLLSDPRASDEVVREVEIKLTESFLKDEGRLNNLERLVLDLGEMLKGNKKFSGRESDFGSARLAGCV